MAWKVHDPDNGWKKFLPKIQSNLSQIIHLVAQIIFAYLPYHLDIKDLLDELQIGLAVDRALPVVWVLK